MLLRYNDDYYLVGKYQGDGGKRIEKVWNRWYEKEVNFSQMQFYGNPVAIYRKRYINWDDRGKSDAYKDFCTDDQDFYKKEQIETFVWIPIKKVDCKYKISELTEDELAILMRDIVGEAG
jgi:hypothetical protein